MQGTRLDAAALKKKFRVNEFVAEKFITGVAFLSLAAIILIFFFVFREAAPIFFEETKDPGETVVVEEEQETYGEEFLGEGSAVVAEGRSRSESIETSGHEGDASDFPLPHECRYRCATGEQCPLLPRAAEGRCSGGDAHL